MQACLCSSAATLLRVCGCPTRKRSRRVCAGASDLRSKWLSSHPAPTFRPGHRPFKELVSATTLTMDGMPASPNQIAVLSGVAGLIGIKGDLVTPAIAKLLTKQTVQVMERLHKVSFSPEVND